MLHVRIGAGCNHCLYRGSYCASSPQGIAFEAQTINSSVRSRGSRWREEQMSSDG